MGGAKGGKRFNKAIDTAVSSGAFGGTLGSIDVSVFRDAEENQRRLSAYNSTIDDTTIDAITKNEISDLYNRGASSGELSELINKARAGKGLYAVRKVDQAAKEIRADAPGRTQTVNSLGFTKALGA